MNNLIIRNIGEQNAGKYVCAVVYDGPNEENEHLLEAKLTVPSQYEIRSVNVQKYVGISLTESNCNADKCSIMCSGKKFARNFSKFSKFFEIFNFFFFIFEILIF